MNLLGTLGNNAPFVGLFGTVLGVIEAFHQLADSSNKAAMGNVMSGIAEALIATGVGLFVALPAVVAYNVAQKKIGDIESNAAAMGPASSTAALKTHAHRAAGRRRRRARRPSARDDERDRRPRRALRRTAPRRRDRSADRRDLRRGGSHGRCDAIGAAGAAGSSAST